VDPASFRQFGSPAGVFDRWGARHYCPPVKSGRDRVSRAVLVIAAFVGAVSLALGLGKVLFGDWDSTADRVIFGALTIGGSVLISAGLFSLQRRPWLAAVSVVVGGLACALALFWTLLLPLLAIALIPLAVVRAGRVAAEPASA
jgi:hypothetical protein